MTKKPIISFRFPITLIDRIKAVAMRQGVSQTQVVESILDSNLPQISAVAKSAVEERE